MKQGKNWLIYQFHNNLAIENFGYFKRYCQKHGFLDQDGNIKHILGFAI